MLWYRLFLIGRLSNGREQFLTSNIVKLKKASNKSKNPTLEGKVKTEVTRSNLRSQPGSVIDSISRGVYIELHWLGARLVNHIAKLENA